MIQQEKEGDGPKELGELKKGRSSEAVLVVFIEGCVFHVGQKNVSEAFPTISESLNDD